MKKAIRILLLLGFIFFVGKKICKIPEVNSLKKIYKIHQKGAFEEASILLDEHVQKYPNSSYSWSFLGTVSMQLYNNPKAENAFKKAFELDRKNDKAIVGLGVIARNNGNHLLAREMYEKALTINPSNPDAYSSLLMLEIFDKNYSKAVELGEKAEGLVFSDSKAGIIGNLVVAYHLNGQFEQRDLKLAELELTNYREKESIKMIINNEINIDQLFKN